MTELCDAGRTVLVETSGEADVSRVDPRVHKIMDLKAPGSGESHATGGRTSSTSARDEIKFVLADRADYEWMRDAIRARKLPRRTPNLLASTVFGKLRDEGARRVGPRGQAARARAAPDAQVHLGPRGAGRVTRTAADRPRAHRLRSRLRACSSGS